MGSQWIGITITMDDTTSKIVSSNPSTGAITIEIIDCTPNATWLSQSSPMEVDLMSGAHTVSLSNVPTNCESLMFEVYHHGGYTAPSWITGGQIQGSTSITLQMNDSSIVA